MGPPAEPDSAIDPDLLARERLAAIVDSSDDAIVAKDLNGIIQSWNASAQRIFGYRPEEVIGKHISIIIPENLRPEEDVILSKLRRGERISHFETIRRRKDGVLVDISLTVSPIHGPDGRVVGASKVARDITEQKRAQRALLELNTRLEDMVRKRTEALERSMRDVESFNHAVAHDLRTPIRAMLGFSRILLDSPNLTAEEKEHVEYIRQSAEQMNRITQALLNLSQIRSERIARAPVDLTAISRDVMRHLREANPERNAEIEIEDGLVADADPALAGIVMQNLLSNAWKFTSGRADTEIHVGRGTRQDNTMFFVRDNGVGFRPTEAAKILGGFNRLRPSEFEGSGIGLTTVNRIVQAHGGDLLAEGRPGEGATIWFTFGLPRRTDVPSTP